ncbi:30803_t:CDS:2, partial [Racocetra persica]
ELVENINTNFKLEDDETNSNLTNEDTESDSTNEKTDSDLINKETGSQNKIQEFNKDIYLKFLYITNTTDKLQESNLLMWDSDYLPNLCHLPNSNSFTNNELDNIDNQFSKIIKLENHSSKEIAERVKYQLEFEEYSETAPDGVACIYNVSGLDLEIAHEIFDLKNIQYSYKESTTLKFCQYILPEIKNTSHTIVNFGDELFKKIFEANELLIDTATLNNEITHGVIQKPDLQYPVQFWHYIPKNLEEYPFIIILSRGIHNHPAPPPTKTPKSILNDLKDIIYNKDILDLTAHRLLNQPILILYLKEVPLPQLHLFLNNLSKIDALIASKKCAEHPYLQNIYGVAYLLMRQSNKNLYIRTISKLLNDSQYLVLCEYKTQIKGLRNLKYIEIDISFKQVHGPINEWEICAYGETYKKKLFLCIEHDTKKPVNFYHINNCGIGCILADEHHSQAL